MFSHLSTLHLLTMTVMPTKTKEVSPAARKHLASAAKALVKLNKAREAEATARSERDKAIEAAYAEGLSVVSIAKHLGMSPSVVFSTFRRTHVNGNGKKAVVAKAEAKPKVVKAVKAEAKPKARSRAKMAASA